MRKEKWILTVYNSENEVSSICLINETELGVRKKMVEMIQDYVKNNDEGLEYCGAEYPDDIDYLSERDLTFVSINKRCLHSVIRYDDYHVSYTAVRLADTVKL